MPIIPAVLATTAGVAAVAAPSIIAATQSGKTDMPQAAAVETPSVAESTAKAKATTKAKLQATRRSQSIYTSPLGLTGQADVAKKTLLGM